MAVISHEIQKRRFRRVVDDHLPKRANGIRRPGAGVYRKEHPMMDLVMLAIGLGFFALSVGYTVACDRL
jgi:hypothetical protein